VESGEWKDKIIMHDELAGIRMEASSDFNCRVIILNSVSSLICNTSNCNFWAHSFTSFSGFIYSTSKYWTESLTSCLSFAYYNTKRGSLTDSLTSCLSFTYYNTKCGSWANSLTSCLSFAYYNTKRGSLTDSLTSCWSFTYYNTKCGSWADSLTFDSSFSDSPSSKPASLVSTSIYLPFLLRVVISPRNFLSLKSFSFFLF
jgi:hypothetical protein